LRRWYSRISIEDKKREERERERERENEENMERWKLKS